MRLATARGCNFIFIDECSFNPRNLGNRTWVSKTNPVKIERQTDGGACHLISGLSTDGESFTVIRTNGANSKVEFCNFLVDLDLKLAPLRKERTF